MKLSCGCIIDGRNKSYKHMCLAHIKTYKPNVQGWKGKQTASPYICMSCGHKTGWSWVENKHDCNNPMFDKKGNINPDYKDGRRK